MPRILKRNVDIDAYKILSGEGVAPLLFTGRYALGVVR